MKKRILNYNDLVRKYYRYIRRRHNLMLANKNHRRQAILTKHIERLHAKLTSLRLNLKKGSLVAGVMAGAITINTNSAKAQDFAAPVENPFSLTNYSGYAGLSSSCFYDLDNDGDLDLLYEDGNGINLYRENTGSNTAPVFGAVQVDPFGLDGSYGSWRSVFIADLDNDGDGDFIMNANGNWVYQENTGTANAPSFAAAQVNPYGLSYSYDYSTVDLQDLDNDGDLDLISGTYEGNFHYFENTGTASAPAFSAYIINPFGLAQISSQFYNQVTLGDLDQDGDLDIMAGDGYGDFYYFENTGTSSAPAFAAEVQNPFNLVNVGGTYGYYTNPTFVDLDNDGDLDIMARSYGSTYGVYGDFMYFENVYSYAGIKEESSIENLEVYPNPSNSIVNIDFETTGENVNVEIISIDGKIVYQHANFNVQTAIDVSSWNAGTYTVKVMSNSSFETIPLVVE